MMTLRDGRKWGEPRCRPGVGHCAAILYKGSLFTSSSFSFFHIHTIQTPSASIPVFLTMVKPEEDVVHDFNGQLPSCHTAHIVVSERAGQHIHLNSL